MFIDMGPIIYVTLALYVVGGIVLAVLLSLVAWAAARGVKRMQARNSQGGEVRQGIEPFSHSPQHGRA